MKLSLQLLQDFITLREEDPNALSEQITRAVAEVDEVEILGELLNNCCVGEIITVERHPNADKLRLCDVKTDRGVKRVVCGGTNLVPGMTVAFAHVGAKVRHGKEIVTLESATIRGQASDGMLCAAEELDLAEQFPPKPGEGDRPIIDLRLSPSTAGKPLAEALGLGDVVFHIDNHAITHRADLFSHQGFARELVTLGLAEWKERKEPQLTFSRDALPFQVELKCPSLVPRYAGCLIVINELGKTPDWMVQRLASVGFRSVSLPVDITNLVAAELGVPLHAFDADDLQGNLQIRQSTQGEHLKTLDNIERELPEGALILSDDAGVFDLLGIMGGLRTSTTQNTRRIFLHCASLDPMTVRRAIIATGHRTDAATVYEKGVPRSMVEPALKRATQLFLELVPGAKIASALISTGEDGTTPTIELPLERVTRLLGVEVPTEQSKKILEDLGCTVKADADALTVTPATWRGDLKTPIDLIEEIGRIYGYNRIEARMPTAELRLPSHERRIHRIRDTLKNTRFTEILPLSLTGEEAIRMAHMNPAEAIAIDNPITEDLKLLQTSTLPGLLQHAARNVLQTHETLRTFRWSHVFRKTNEGHSEDAELALLHAQFSGKPQLRSSPALSLAQAVRDVLKTLNTTASITRLQNVPAYAHPGQAAAIKVGDQTLGIVCTLHPEVQAAFDLPGTVAVAILDLNRVLTLPSKDRSPTPLPAFPAITYDETISLTHEQDAATVITGLLGADPLLADVEVTDLYDGAELPAGTYRMTLRFTYRTGDRTLAEEEAKTAHSAVMAKLASE